ncbi:MAG: hypothetical protein FD172_3823, partial [Methylocystaceae bacterium]
LNFPVIGLREGNKAGKRWVEKAAGNETTSRSPGLR